MDLIKRIEGVFFNPRPVFEGLAAKPVWVDALVVALIALIAFNLVVSPYGQKDQLQFMKDHPSLKERLGEDVYNSRIEALENPTVVGVLVQTVVGTLIFFLLALLIQSLALLIMGRFGSTQGTYVHVLSVLVHATLIDKLFGNSVRLVLILTRRSVMQTSTSLALLFPKMEVTSTPYILLSQVDFFQLWLFGVLALGLVAVFRIGLKKALVLSYVLWFLKALVNAGLALLPLAFIR